ncbi:PREDICTED: uncharacterized protein LOC104773905 [Camelina sativa]|uniref:Uncharacterized protein LOC104773905 n=1 Tax=Camelina sativa TaxID=90675 RepID=A0ABM0Y7S4_CAMSA|nr:PREDICTED: uncharacterized protein LOC104773905 [Camelina sativa]
MGAYRHLVQTLSGEFTSFSLMKVPRNENASLAALANRSDPDLRCTIPIECVDAPSIDPDSQIAIINDNSVLMEVDEPKEDMTEIAKPPDDWQLEIKLYISEGIIPPDRWAARRLKARSAKYILLDGELFCRSVLLGTKLSVS